MLFTRQAVNISWSILSNDIQCNLTVQGAKKVLDVKVKGIKNIDDGASCLWADKGKYSLKLSVWGFFSHLKIWETEILQPFKVQGCNYLNWKS